jgi:hypothetical protein
VGNEIFLHEVPQLVTLEIYVSGWFPSLLKALQATVDSAGYSNGVGGTLVPLGWPGSPEDGCFIDTGRANYVFDGMSAIDAVSTADLDYIWGATLLFGEKADDDQTYYLGTLILEVPIDASGTYTIGFLADVAKTFMKDNFGASIVPLILTPALITINHPPTVQITSPSSGAIVSGIITIQGIASDSDGSVTQVELRIDSGSWWTTTGTTSWNANFDTNTVSDGLHTVDARSKDNNDAYSPVDSISITVYNAGANQPPNKPSVPSGKVNGKSGVSYTYSSTTTDPDGDQIQYLFDWGDGQTSPWTSPVNSGLPSSASYSWSRGSYQIKVKARDVPSFSESPWSDPLSVSMLKNKIVIYDSLFLRFLEQFPILARLLNL